MWTEGCKLKREQCLSVSFSQALRNVPDKECKGNEEKASTQAHRKPGFG